MATGANLTGLRAILADLPEAIDAGLHQAGELIGDLAQQLAPEDTGALKESKQVRQNARGRWEVSFGEGLPDIRAAAQEFGTESMPAQPYLTPAAQAIDVPLEVAKSISALIARHRI